MLYNSTIKEGNKMIQFYVHYIAPSSSSSERMTSDMRMIHPVVAKTEAEAIKICKLKRPGSFGHWINTRALGGPLDGAYNSFSAV
jgi:hypothetical protein